MRTVVVLTEAAEDIESARDFYDAQDPGMGDILPIRFRQTSKVWRYFMGYAFASTVFSECWLIVFPSASTIVT